MAAAGFVEFFDKHYLGLDAYFEVHRERFIESWQFIEAQGVSNCSTVLDVGGVGPLASFMNATFGTAVFESKTDLRGALDFESGKFELIICTETIEHIKDRESSKLQDLESFNFSGVDSLLGELHRVCTPEGAVMLTTPNANSFVTLHKWLAGEALMMDPNHVREFSLKDLREHCEKAGFQVQCMQTRDTWRKTFGKPVEVLSKALNLLVGESNVERGDNIFAMLRIQ